VLCFQVLISFVPTIWCFFLALSFRAKRGIWLCSAVSLRNEPDGLARFQESRFLHLVRAFGAQSWLRFGFVLHLTQSDFLCFHRRTGFVRIILVFVASPIFPHRRDPSAFPCASARPGARLRQCVHNKTTIVGYHNTVRLSSGKCKKVSGLSRFSSPCGARPREEG
jgi:hypothetical protein